jgi:hypothetical protein
MSVADLPAGISSSGMDRFGFSIHEYHNSSDPHRFEPQRLGTGRLDANLFPVPRFVGSVWPQDRSGTVPMPSLGGTLHHGKFVP